MSKSTGTQKLRTNLTWDSEHTVQYTDEVLQNCTPETYIIL